jgi:hypothetical protein
MRAVAGTVFVKYVAQTKFSAKNPFSPNIISFNPNVENGRQVDFLSDEGGMK